MMINPFSLDRRTVLIVGASSGIGAATAQLANLLGAHVLLASRSRTPLEQVRDSLVHIGASEILTFDYLDTASISRALDGNRRIDHVVIPAVADENKKRGGFLDLSIDVMHASFDKFWGQVNVLRAVAPHLTVDGSAVLFASVAGLKPPSKGSGLSIMNAVQAAVMQLGRSLAIELAPRRFNIIAPGVVLTNVWTEAERMKLERWMVETLPVARTGLPDHIAQAAIGLMTNPYATGVVLPIDGGVSLQ